METNEIIDMDYNENDLLDALKSRNVSKLREIFETYNLVDIAETISKLEDINEYLFIFKTIPPEYTAEVFSYLDSEIQEDIVSKLTSEQISSILENLYSDDIVDFLQELPANLINRILNNTPPNRRKQINQLLSYADDTAGSIMTTEFIMLQANDDSKRAIEKVKRFGKKAESISYLYVTDAKRTLIGTTTLKDIIYMEDDETVKDIMETDYVYVYTNTDQEEAAQIFKKYDLPVIPVITNDDRLVGIVTSDDIIDVIEEEATEDIHMMANVNPLEDEYLKTSAFTIAKKGVGWLVLLMILATFTSFIMNKFDDKLAILPALSIFIPMLIDTAGNAGNQTSAVIIRAIGLGEVNTKDYFKVVGKELLTAIMVGAAVSVANFLWIFLLGKVGIIDLSGSSVNSFQLGLLVAAAMFTSICLSKFIGSSLPLLCKALKIDPALLAGPMVTTLVDASSLIIYFLFATLIFHYI